MKMIRQFAVTAAYFLLVANFASAKPAHGIAMHGDPALPADFKFLPYANPEAPKVVR